MPVVPRRGPGYVPTTPNQPLNPAGAFQPPRPVNFDPAADEVGKVVEEHQALADQTAVLDANNQLASLSTNLQVQALQMRGKDALDAGPQVKDAWQKGSSDIENTLTNNRQKARFQVLNDHHWQLLNESVQKHGASEFHNYQNDTTEASIATARNTALAHPDDPSIVGQSVAETRDLAATYGKLNGWSPEQIQEKQGADVSKVHAGLTTLLADSGQDLAAKQYFTAHKDELVGNDLIHSTAVIKESSVKGEAQRQRDLILSDTQNVTDAIQQVRQIKDPLVQEATERLVRQDLAEKAAGLRDQHEQTMTDLGNAIDQGGLNSIPPSQWSTLTPTEKKSLLEYSKAKTDPGGVKTDLPTFYNLETMATTPETRDKFLTLDLNQYKSRLSPSDFEEMAKLQGSVRKGDDKPVMGIETKHQLVTDVLKQAQIGVDKKGRVLDAGLVATFRGSVDRQITLLKEQTGREPGADDIARIANEMATRHVVQRPGMIWGTNAENVRTFQLNPGEQPQIQSIQDVPPDAKRQIRNALTNRGRAVTDQAIMNEYRAHVQTLLPEP